VPHYGVRFRPFSDTKTSKGADLHRGRVASGDLRDGEKLMNLDRMNQWLSLTANAGVIAGFILLAVQMKQNTDALQLQNQIELGRGAMTTDIAAMGDSAYIASTVSILEPELA
jgi:hypothetical protein